MGNGDTSNSQMGNRLVPAPRPAREHRDKDADGVAPGQRRVQRQSQTASTPPMATGQLSRGRQGEAWPGCRAGQDTRTPGFVLLPPPCPPLSGHQALPASPWLQTCSPSWGQNRGLAATQQHLNHRVAQNVPKQQEEGPITSPARQRRLRPTAPTGLARVAHLARVNRGSGRWGGVLS